VQDQGVGGICWCLLYTSPTRSRYYVL